MILYRGFPNFSFFYFFLHNRHELRVSLSPTFIHFFNPDINVWNVKMPIWAVWCRRQKFGQVLRDQETAHEEFFVLADGPNLTGNQIYCICCSLTRRRYTDERNITRYCSVLHQSFAETFFNAADNFVSGHVWPVRPKSVKVLWIFKVVERSLDILLLPKDIQSLFPEM